MKKVKKLVVVTVVLTMLVGVFASCKSPQAPAPAPASKTMDKLTATVATEPQTIDPALNDAVDGADYILHMLEGLTTFDKDGKITNGVASSWDTNADKTVYTFHLRDAKWSDGKAITASDFVYSWQRVIDPATASPYENYMEYVKNGAAIFKAENGKKPADLGVKAIDDKTLEVTLEAPCGFFLDLCAFPVYLPVRQDIVSANKDWTQNPTTYLANGPYKMDSWTHDSELVMVKNDKYWNAANITGPKTLVWKMMNDQNAILTAYKTGQLQYAEGLPTAEYDNLKKSNDLKIYPLLGTYYMDMNNGKAPFNNVDVRHAINLVIDRNYIVEKITMGGQLPANNFVPSGVKQPDGSDFASKATPPFDISAASYENNVKQAQDLMTKAGYPNGANFPSFTYLTNDSGSHVAIATYIQSVLKEKLGINMTVQKMDWDAFLAARQKGDYVVARDGWIADYADPMTFLGMFKTGDGNNNAKYSNKDYDALIDAANKETDAAKRFQEMQDAQKIFMNTDYGVAPIYFYTSPAAVNPSLQGLLKTPTGFTIFFWTTQK